MSARKEFEQFLSEIDLDGYRKQYSRIKLVELDLPRNIQALNHIYGMYWNKRQDFPDFDQFYEKYRGDLSIDLENFREVTRFSRETFELGLPARIYRTWASLLTQIQAGYVAESIFGNKSVEMSAELDWQGIDMVVINRGMKVNIQIKKETLSREVRRPHIITKRNKKIMNLQYEVPGCDPLTPTGKESQPFKRWVDKWHEKLDRLENGFIIFRSEMFLEEELFGTKSLKEGYVEYLNE